MKRQFELSVPAGGSEAAAGAAFLLVTSLIWGCAFVAQSVAMDYVGPFTFCFSRFLISGVCLIFAVLLRRRLGLDRDQGLSSVRRGMSRRTALIGGIVCGIFLFGGAGLQQVGIQYTTAGKAGFLTALYIILVPIYGIAFGKAPGKKVWIAACMALFGMYLLCMEGYFRLSRGDLFCVFCALGFPFQILAVDYFAAETDAVQLSCVQFLTVAFISGILAFLLEEPSLETLFKAAVPVLYAGVLSGAVAYTFQIVGQQKMRNPSAASLIMSLESVFAALAGWILLGQGLTPRKLLGCVIMFAAIILAQL